MALTLSQNSSASLQDSDVRSARVIEVIHEAHDKLK